jgi:hypothetical protein
MHRSQAAEITMNQRITNYIRIPHYQISGNTLL